MKCPNDDTTLLITERQDVEIDYCPDCRGVWLDRGELDKLLRRDHDDYDDDSGRYDDERRRPDHDREPRRPEKRKKKKGWLSDILEIGQP